MTTPAAPSAGGVSELLDAAERNLEGIEGLPLDLQVRALCAVEADLRSALEGTRS
ncbi:MAG: hypothetical protein L0H81_03265 [Actinomyces sp.]|nr:hypothetical protein [Actinomyces sp.]MDN6428524.1 hypothetical protein [Propionibacterium sp.]MDN6793523.1 hypothetical protein [Propionibacterium sp.]